MGTIIKKVDKVKLFSGFIFADPSILDKVISILIKKYGPIDLHSQIFDFTQTNYYKKEMGSNLKKTFVSFKKLIPREKIADVKIFTNKIEDKLALKKNRQINIDPGYVSLPNVALATTKDYQHRIYIGKGIYLENTLRFKKGIYDDWEWTYPDFQTKEYKMYFFEVLKLYKKQLRGIL